MLSIRLDKEMQEKLDRLSKVTKRSKSFFVKEALKSYLDDLEDLYEAQIRSNDRNRNLISVKELEKALDL